MKLFVKLFAVLVLIVAIAFAGAFFLRGCDWQESH